MIEDTLTTLLRTVCPHVSPLIAPKGVEAPFLTYQRVVTNRLRDLQGSAGVAYATFRVDLYDHRFRTLRVLAQTCRTTLEAYRDGEVMSVSCQAERDLSDLTSDPKLFRVQLEFQVQHRE